MNGNFEDIIHAYEGLSTGEASSWEIYGGENFQEMAQERGIPERKWKNDRIEMQLGQEVMAEELARGVPKSAEEQVTRLRAFVQSQISSRLKSEGDAVAQKGVLLQALQAGQRMDSVQLAAMSQKSVAELQGQLVDLTVAYTMQTVLPAIRHQCDLLLQKPEQQTKILSNAGALAAAYYLEVPALQQAPFVLGAASEVIRQQNLEKTAEVLQKIAFGLLLVAGILVGLSLMTAEAAVLGSAVAHVLTEGTVAGLGSAVVSDLAPVAGFIGNMLAAALGSALLGGLAKKLAHLCEERAEIDTETAGPNIQVSYVPV